MKNHEAAPISIPEIKLAVIYSRWSPRPGMESDSDEHQEARCRSYAESNGYHVIGCYRDEGISGKSAENRVGLQAAMEWTVSHKATLFVYSLSRLARNTIEAVEIAERLSKNECGLLSLKENLDTSTPTGRFTLTIMAAVAQLEREQIAERISDAMTWKQSNGMRMSRHAPYGYKFENDKIVVDEKEHEVVSLIMRLYNSGSSFWKIREYLISTNILTRAGECWRIRQIKKIINRNLENHKKE